MKSYLVLGTIALALMLSGCGGGSSNDNSAASTPERTHFVIKNSQSQDIAKITYVSDDNETIFDTNFTCKVNENCDYYAEVGKPGTVFLYNQSNVFLSAYPLAEAPTYIQFITPSDHMTGIYVYESLVKKYALTNFTVNEKMAAFFSNFPGSDGVVNIYARLGQYYKKEAIGNGVSYNGFLQKTYDSMTNGVVLPNSYVFALYDFHSILAYVKNQFKFSLINSAHANAGCTAFGAILPGVGEMMEFFPGIGTVMNGVLTASNSLLNEACDDTSDQLRVINEKLDQISADLKAQNRTLSAIADSINKERVAVVFREMVSAKRDLSMYLDLYVTLLGTQYKTLSEYVKAQGGLQKAYEKSPNFAKLVKSGNQQGLQHFVSVLETVGDTDELNNLADSLRAYCKYMGTETGDLAEKRIQCNLWQLRYNTFVMATWANNEVILRDIVGTISEYKSSESLFITNNLVLPGTGSKQSLSWTNWYEDYFSPRMKEVSNYLAKGEPTTPSEHGMFPMARELNTVAKNNWDIEGRLKLLGCSVTSWLPSQTKIVASCKEPNIWATYYFNSEVYYKEDDNLVNYAGVLVPRKSLSANGNYFPDLPSNSETLENNLVLKNSRNANFDTITMFDMLLDLNSPIVISTPLQLTANTTVPPEDDRFLFVNGDLRYVLKGKIVDRKLFYRLTDKTKKPNISYIFGNNFRGGEDDIKPLGSSRMFCMSAGCEYQGHRLGFKDGPQNIWYGLHVPGLDPHTVQWEINGQKQAY